jgi:dTDP-4-amino-4,6-dideoxygalactose transaminase
MSAILGEKPIFDQKINIVKPKLPTLDDIEPGVADFLTSGMVTKGKNLLEFEKKVAEHLQVKHAIGVSSCTTGLMLTYQALKLSGEVIVPSFTFMATVSALVWCGLTPIYVDVDFGTTNINPELIEQAITPATTAIVAVHNFGNPAAIQELEDIASRHQLKLIFDAAHGFGSLYQGFPVGSQGDAQVFSLSPTKLLIAGEGGIVSTNDDRLAENIRMGREYGNSGNYDSAFAGMNARLAEFNALLGTKSLDLLEKAADHRNMIANYYVEVLGSLPGLDFQEIALGNRSSYKDFSFTVNAERFGLSRDELAQVLLCENIDVRKYYDPPVHKQTAYQSFYKGQDLSITERLANESLSIPVWSHMDVQTAEKVCQAISNAYQEAPLIRKKISG